MDGEEVERMNDCKSFECSFLTCRYHEQCQYMSERGLDAYLVKYGDGEEAPGSLSAHPCPAFRNCTGCTKSDDCPADPAEQTGGE